MRKILEFFIICFLRAAFWFRYRITVKGLNNLNKLTLSKSGGTLFLPNHPAVFVDPSMITIALWKKYSLRPMVVEYMYYTPVINWIMRLMDALPVPNFTSTSNSLKRKKSEKVMQTVIDSLRKGDNFLIYPSGKTKSTSYESIGGASGVHRIISEVPEANVVLVRIKGLWGSSFSRAFTGKPPAIFPTIWEGMKHVFKNLLFFTPRRQVIIEFEPAPADFPYGASRLEMNKYLEAWYNKPDGLSVQTGTAPGDSFMLVSYSAWGEIYPESLIKEFPEETTFSLDTIPKDVQEKVISKLVEMTEYHESAIKPGMSLSTDLGLDSLDIAELASFVQHQFDILSVPVNELTTVGRVMEIAASKFICPEEKEETTIDLSKWKRHVPHNRAAIAPGESIIEVFLNNCDLQGDRAACGDNRTGVMTYSQMKMRTIILANYIKELPGEYVGILLPASVVVNLLVLAVQLAGKIPLVINWTVGKRHLETVASLSKVEVVLSSWAFLDRLESVDLDGIDDKLIMLEDLRQEIGIVDKIKAAYLSKFKSKHILKKFGVERLAADNIAVLLFTSGTESMPKGVPLTHRNILVNQRDTIEAFELYIDDVIYGILPPFHAFGFTCSCLLGVLSGIRVAFSPDPTDGKLLAAGFKQWGVTVMCGAPTFIKGMLKAALPGDLDTMRICATGAEKAPPELFQLMEQVGKGGLVYEGYGITECSPVLTFNRFGEEQRGVGKAAPSVELCIVHPETLDRVPNGAQGLILAAGPNIFSGYLNPGISSPFITIEGKKWFKTGDLGFLDEKQRLTISGRMKRFIKIGPEMVSLASVEDALLQAAPKKGWPTDQEGPSIAVCAKEVSGEKPKLFLFTKFQVTLDDVNKTLKEVGFSNLVKISSVICLEEIPIMGTGKINYRLLENEYVNKT